MVSNGDPRPHPQQGAQNGMTPPLASSRSGITIVGSGACSATLLDSALRHAPVLVAANGGCRIALRHGRFPDHVIGDADSLAHEDGGRIPPNRLHRIDDQETTDFDKCVRLVSAPLIIGTGVLTPRLDHGMACMNTMLRNPSQPIVLLGESEIITLVQPEMKVKLPTGSRVSLVPLVDTKVWSTGLKWPLEGMMLSMSGKIGTSNESVSTWVGLRVDGPGLLLMVSTGNLDVIVDALLNAPAWR